MRRVTEEQRRTINAVACLTLLHGRTPALGEIAEVLHITKEAVHARLHWLEKKDLWQPADIERTDDGRWGRLTGALTTSGLRSALGLPR